MNPGWPTWEQVAVVVLLWACVSILAGAVWALVRLTIGENFADEVDAPRERERADLRDALAKPLPPAPATRPERSIRPYRVGGAR